MSDQINPSPSPIAHSIGESRDKEHIQISQNKGKNQDKKIQKTNILTTGDGQLITPSLITNGRSPGTLNQNIPKYQQRLFKNIQITTNETHITQRQPNIKPITQNKSLQENKSAYVSSVIESKKKGSNSTHREQQLPNSSITTKNAPYMSLVKSIDNKSILGTNNTNLKVPVKMSFTLPRQPERSKNLAFQSGNKNFEQDLSNRRDSPIIGVKDTTRKFFTEVPSKYKLV